MMEEERLVRNRFRMMLSENHSCTNLLRLFTSLTIDDEQSIKRAKMSMIDIDHSSDSDRCKTMFMIHDERQAVGSTSI
jgi:hypothetical protein